MPEMKNYTVTQTRSVSVTANSEIDAARIADAAFKYGQDENGGVAKNRAPAGVWGNSTSKIQVSDFRVERA